MKKPTIHIIQNSHTDLGYTHRQEYVYRAHARYIDYAIEMAKKNKNFKYSLENFWMYENYCKWNTQDKVKELNKFIAKGNIEVTSNYLNLLNIFDKKAFQTKVKKVIKLFPDVKVAVQQDVNAISKDQALILYENGIKYIYASIHTHHGMFVGAGKQRGFIWNLGDNKKIIVWAGEHYMLGNELGINLSTPNRYVFKDDINLENNSPIKNGAKRLNGYLKVLENENYEQNHIPIVASGSVIDNSPPNIKILEGISNLQAEMDQKCNVKLSSFTDFFASIDDSKLLEFKGEWPSWWIDGVISTPEAVRQYREAQIIYHNLKTSKKESDEVFNKKLAKLEDYLLIFSEHTWGGWASQFQPFSNGNNLLLSRKKAFATKASEIAWELWDSVKEGDGYNIVKINSTNEVVVKNIHNQKLEKLLAIEIPRHLRLNAQITKDRYVESEDILEIKDNNGKKYDYVVTKKLGLGDNFNTSIESDEIILLNVSLKPQQKIKLRLTEKEENYKARTSSFRNVGVDNQEDVFNDEVDWCRYIQNGIENKYYKILWNDNGIYSIYDKELNIETLDQGRYIDFIRVLSDDKRHLFGRNRQGPSAKTSKSQLISHQVVHKKQTGIIVKLIFKLNGVHNLELLIRLTSFAKNIRFQINFLKDGYLQAENMYFSLPFQFKKIQIEKGGRWFTPGQEQLPLTNLDYYSCDKGILFRNKTFDIGITMHDTPLLQTGSLKFESRKLMDKKTNNSNFDPKVWLMTNYWETNYKGSLEGCYSFAFDIYSGKNIKQLIDESHHNLISYNVWKRAAKDDKSLQFKTKN